MSHKINLVRVLTGATGNSTPITLGVAYSQLFMTPAEAGAMDGRTYTYNIVDGNNWEIGKGVYTSSGTTLARTTVLYSRIAGTLGTSRISLSGTAQVRFVDSAEDMDGIRGTRNVTGTTDTLNNSDLGYVVTYSNASAVAVSLAQASVSNLFTDGWATWVQNLGAGLVTITPTTSTIQGASMLPLASGMGAMIWSDGTNYRTFYFPVTKPLLAANNLSELVAKNTAMDNLSIHGSDIASASTVNLETATGNFVHVTGTTAITAITLSDGHQRTVYFTGALVLTNGASLVLPGGANITTAAGDIAVFVADGTTIRCSDYFPASQASARALIGLGTAAVRADTDFLRTDTAQLLSAMQRGQAAANLQFIAPPQGRLTLVSGSPVMTTTQSAKTTLYYTPYVGNQIPVYDGTNLIPTSFSELSVVTTDTSKNPAAIGASKVNDWYVWNDSSTIRLSHGPDRASDTAAGDFVVVNGIRLNNSSITNGPASQRGTYVGTTRSNASSQVDHIFGSSAAGGGAAFFGLWNAYNRVDVATNVKDTNINWVYGSSTVRAADASNNNRVNFVSGLAEDAISASYRCNGVTSGVLYAGFSIGLGLDTVTSLAIATSHQNIAATAVTAALGTDTTFAPQAGFHFIQALEVGDNSNNTSFNSNSAQQQLAFKWKH